MRRKLLAIGAVIALMIAAALPVVAAPTSTHTLSTAWVDNDGTSITRGSVEIVVPETGGSAVTFLQVRSSPVDCDGVSDVQTETVRYAGPAQVASTFGRHAGSAGVSFTVDAALEVTACGSTVTSTVSLPVTVAATATTKPNRFRDSTTGTRFISTVVAADSNILGISRSTTGSLTEAIS